jgi:hypothetical protein
MKKTTYKIFGQVSYIAGDGSSLGFTGRSGERFLVYPEYVQNTERFSIDSQAVLEVVGDKPVAMHTMMEWLESADSDVRETIALSYRAA